MEAAEGETNATTTVDRVASVNDLFANAERIGVGDSTRLIERGVGCPAIATG